MREATVTPNLLTIASAIQEAIVNKVNTVRIWGSAGSGKTYSLLLIILDYLLDNPNRRILCLTYNYEQAKRALGKDLCDILRDLEIPHKTNSYKREFKFFNGSELSIVNPSDDGFGKGMRNFDMIYVDEVDRFKEEVIEQVRMRSELMICTFNPVNSFVKFWNNTVDCKVTFEGNPMLSEIQRDYLLAYEKNRFNEDGSINPIRDAWYKVYCLGDWSVNLMGAFGDLDLNHQFDNFQPQAFGLDFSNAGPAKGDPDSLVGIQIIGRDIYVRNYFQTNEYDTKQLIAAIRKANPRNIPITCDSANGRMINELKLAGLNVRPANKVKSVIEQIRLLNDFTIHCEPSDKVLVKELSSYGYEDSSCTKLIDKDNHSIDAMRYGLQTILPQFTNRATIKLL